MPAVRSAAPSMQERRAAAEFEPPGGWTRLSTLDVHAAGEPLRIVTGGWPPIPGATMLAKRRFAREHHDRLRRALVWEPRGHADMYGAIPTEAVTEDGDLGVLFLHNEGFSTMCGHGVIALVTAGLTCGLFEPAAPPAVALDTPAGRVLARAELASGRVARVAFENVPSFVCELEREVVVEGLGTVRFDLAFGGAFYAFVEARAVGLELAASQAARIVEVGRRVSRAVRRSVELRHPGGSGELEFLYGTIFTAPTEGAAFGRHACVFAEGELDRSPTGTGVSARAALLFARGELELGQRLSIEGLAGMGFRFGVVRAVRTGGLDAVVPEVEGSAHLTGRHEFWIDPEDPLGAGFLLR